MQIQEQLTEFQLEMRDQMLELQRTMVSQFNQLLAGEKRKDPMDHSRVDNEVRTEYPDTIEAPRKKENRGNNANRYNKGHSKPITVGRSKTETTRHRSPLKQESEMKSCTEKLQFTPILTSYKELYQRLFDARIVSPFYLKPLQPPYPKWYDTNVQCDYHAGITGHSIENCTAFKKLVERFINMGIVKFEDSLSTENPLLNHTDNERSAMNEEMLGKIHISAEYEEATGEEILLDVRPYKLGSVLKKPL
ncbi:hypothetical protein V6Z12_D11G236200 [Gossypium hirsutum]